MSFWGGEIGKLELGEHELNLIKDYQNYALSKKNSIGQSYQGTLQFGDVSSTEKPSKSHEFENMSSDLVLGTMQELGNLREIPEKQIHGSIFIWPEHIPQDGLLYKLRLEPEHIFCIINFSDTVALELQLLQTGEEKGKDSVTLMFKDSFLLLVKSTVDCYIYPALVKSKPTPLFVAGVVRFSK